VPYIRYEREFIDTPDGGEIALGKLFNTLLDLKEITCSKGRVKI
jgi:hypothetical protein